MSAFGLPILLSAFLLFQVQPMAAKAILPWFGGSPAVWTTSMLFFQTLLLAGYLYADRLIRILAPRAQTRVHLLLLATTIFALPLGIDAAWKPIGTEAPVPRILALLAASVGLPYFALATTGPLLQAWAASGGRAPYRLYAVSNLGSLAALLTYPVLVEPLLTIGQQFRIWSCGYAAYVVSTGLVAMRAGRRPPGAVATRGEVVEVSYGLRAILWAGLSACASVLLLAVTNEICQEVAVVPFLWLLPLTVYLLTFILCFDSDRWYRRALFLPALLVVSAAAVYAVIDAAKLTVPLELTIYTAYLFVACMVCHGELVSLRPDGAGLTRFYLMISLGGALGGAFVALAAPVLFRLFFELHVGIVACLALAAMAVIAQSPASFRRYRWHWLVWFEATLAVSIWLCLQAAAALEGARIAARNFYGTLRVVDLHERDESITRRHLMHGLTNHGFQFLDRERRRAATSYYGPRSGVGTLLSGFRSDHGRRVGVLGLGTGTVAVYGRPGDIFRFFEINPLVPRFAGTEFTFLADSAASIGVVVADARLALEQEHGTRYDVLIADVFSGDAIPVHLLTEEAFRLYFRRLAPGGVLAMNISNRMLDLSPVVTAAADALGVDAVIVESDASRANGWFHATWALLAAEGGALHSLPFDSPSSRLRPLPEKRILWRDDYSNLFQLLR
jgi:hypothetical protein